MKRRAAYFLLCVCFCFSTLSLSSSAVEVEYDPYTGEEMIYDEEEGCYYSPYKPLEFEPSELFRASSPNHDNFDLNKLPWLDMPTYIQDILYSEPQGLSNMSDSDYTGDYKLPFVSIQVTSTGIAICAGYNLCLGAYFKTKDEYSDGIPTAYYLISYKAHAKLYANAVCYFAVYDENTYELRTPWRILEPVAMGDNFVRYVNFGYTERFKDLYFYGSSGMYTGRIFQLMKIDSSDSDSYPGFVTVNDPSAGFASGKIMYLPDNFEAYITSFTPPTPEQQQASTSKGIWETLKEIPQNIANSFSDFFLSLQVNIRGFFTSLGDRISGFFDNLANKIKGFFLPSEGFFDTYVSDFQNYFKDRFGLLYELPDSVIGIMQQFIDYSPADSGYSITFPEVVMPVLDNGDWYDKVIIEETDIKFEFLEQGAFKTLYSMYRSVVWMIFIFALINLIIRKSERVFGGSG